MTGSAARRAALLLDFPSAASADGGSRLPLEDGRVQFLVEDDTPSMHAMLVLRSGRCLSALTVVCGSNKEKAPPKRGFFVLPG